MNAQHTLILAALTLSPSLYAQSTFASIRANQTLAELGESCDLGDFDGDGLADAVVGAPGADFVTLRRGYDGRLIRTIQGSSGDRFGEVVCAMRDVDLDGVDDVLVTAPESHSTAEGYAEVRSGATGALVYPVTRPFNTDYFGRYAAVLGDTNGDGFDDFVIASLFKAHVYSGRDGSRIRSVGNGVDYVNALASAGDLDFDGRPDWLVSFQPDASHRDPYVEVRSGRSLLEMTTIHPESFDPNPGSFGVSLDGVEDWNGDGFADFVIGCQSLTQNITGRAYVYSGLTLSRIDTKLGANTGDSFGRRVRGVGDWDGDGRGDFAVAAPWWGNGYVRVQLSSGGFETITGASSAERFGTSISAGRDADGDGRPDLVVGAVGNDDIATDAGVARIFENPETADTGRKTRYGTPCADQFGRVARCDVQGRTMVGEALYARVESAPFDAPAVLRVAGQRDYVPLDLIGMPGCALWSRTTTGVSVRTSPLGRGLTVLTIPNDASFLGDVYQLQWLVVDVGSAGFGVVASDAVEIQVGG